jgi:Phospholipase_D-nuclease N-terminal/Short C-terminal domain
MTVLAADYPFLDVLWTMLVFFAWVAWFWLLIVIASDVFRRHDIGGGKKAVWLIFMLFVPFIGVLSYLIANNESMTRRNVEQAQAQKAQMDDYVRSVSDGGGAAGQIERAKKLLDDGTITQAEYEAIKSKALA